MGKLGGISTIVLRAIALSGLDVVEPDAVGGVVGVAESPAAPRR